MSDLKPTAYEAMILAATRLRHLSMRYAGAMMELVSQQPVGLISRGHPGFKEARDFIDLILLTRAEINGLTKLLVEAGVTTHQKVTETFAEEYEWLAQQKANDLGVGISDEGLVFNLGPRT